jgi:hypothetical protein
MRYTVRTTEYPAMATGNQCTSHAQRMPGSHARAFAQAMCGMWACACAATSILLIQTGAVAPVSLFALLITVVNLLLVGLLGLVSILALSGLTGLVVSSVGLSKELAPGTKTGD